MIKHPFGQGIGLLVEAYAKRIPRLDIYEDSKEPVNKFRWRIWMSSDIVAASSQGYATRALCIANLKSLRSHIDKLEELGKLI